MLILTQCIVFHSQMVNISPLCGSRLDGKITGQEVPRNITSGLSSDSEADSYWEISKKCT